MRKNQRQYTITTATAIGLAVSILLVIISSCIMTTLILNENANERIANFAEPVVLVLALYIGTLTALKGVKQGYLPASGLIAISYIVITISINIIMFDASFRTPWIELLAVITGSGLGCLTKLKATGKTKHKHSYR